MRTDILGAALLLLAFSPAARAQLPGRCEEPVAARTSEIGCYVAATREIGGMPDTPVYWHIYEFPTRSQAESVKAPLSNIIEAFSRVFLYALADPSWRPSAGTLIAVVGPLPHKPGVQYTARYLEGTIPPGEKTPVHTHAGPEAWYLVDGAQCLETPAKVLVAHAGESSIVDPDVPMMLASVGAQTRHSLALILHDSTHPWTHVVTDGWKPTGRCPK